MIVVDVIGFWAGAGFEPGQRLAVKVDVFAAGGAGGFYQQFVVYAVFIAGACGANRFTAALAQAVVLVARQQCGAVVGGE